MFDDGCRAENSAQDPVILLPSRVLLARVVVNRVAVLVTMRQIVASPRTPPPRPAVAIMCGGHEPVMSNVSAPVFLEELERSGGGAAWPKARLLRLR